MAARLEDQFFFFVTLQSSHSVRSVFFFLRITDYASKMHSFSSLLLFLLLLFCEHYGIYIESYEINHSVLFCRSLKRVKMQQTVTGNYDKIRLKGRVYSRSVCRV